MKLQKLNFWKRVKSIPVEVRILNACKISTTGKKLKNISNSTENETIEEIVSKLKYQDFIQLQSGWGESFEKQEYSLLSKGRFKVIEWENLQKTRSTSRWTIVIAVASVIAAGVASWFSWQDSRSDEVWQNDQLELLQQISEK